MSNVSVTGKPSVDRPWMKYYPEPLRKIQIPECTIKEYLKRNCPGVAYMGASKSYHWLRSVFTLKEASVSSLKGDLYQRLIPCCLTGEYPRLCR